MGPGNVVYGTKWGFSGTQLGENINAVNILEGKPVFCPRISFSDPRRDIRELAIIPLLFYPNGINSSHYGFSPSISGKEENS
jgi:hypothetical protein